MDEKLYRQIVAVIGRHSFQIKVEDEDGYHAFTSKIRNIRVPRRQISLLIGDSL